VRDVKYFAASMDSFHLALYNIYFWAFLGWSLLCWSFLLFHLELFLWFHPETYHLGNPPNFRWCFCLGRMDGGLHAGLSGAPEGRNLLCSPNAERGVLRSSNFQLINFFFCSACASWLVGRWVGCRDKVFGSLASNKESVL